MLIVGDFIVLLLLLIFGNEEVVFGVIDVLFKIGVRVVINV